MTTALGKISFLDTPDVNGLNVLTSGTGVAAGSAVLSTTGTANQITISGTSTAPVFAIADNAVFPGTEGIVLPNGSTAQRPVTPTLGETRYNLTTNIPEVWGGPGGTSTWLPFGRIVQSAAGSINGGLGASVNSRNIATTTAPANTDGYQLFTTNFTPMIVGSNLVLQMSITAYATAARMLILAAFAGTACIGATAASVAAAAVTTTTTGHTVMSLQVVYPTTSTAAVTIQARLIHAMAATVTATTAGWNQFAGGNSMASTMATEWRILELI